MYGSRGVITKTTISQSIQADSNMAKYDAACKCVLAEKIVLAWIMKSCMEEYADCRIQEIADNYILGIPQIGEVPLLPDETNASKIQGTGVEDVTITEGTITFDIRYYAVLPGTGETVRLGKGSNQGENRLLDLLNVLFSTEIAKDLKKDILQNEFQIPMEEKMERRLNEMCNFSKGVWEEAMEKGIERGRQLGIEQGVEQGEKQGIEKGLLTAIHNLMESMGWSAEQAMEALKIPSGKKLEYTAKL